jgi:hypothetical protein
LVVIPGAASSGHRNAPNAQVPPRRVAFVARRRSRHDGRCRNPLPMCVAFALSDEFRAPSAGESPTDATSTSYEMARLRDCGSVPSAEAAGWSAGARRRTPASRVSRRAVSERR